MATQAISLTDAALASNNYLVQGVVEDIITINEWYKYLPFVLTNGLAYTFTREATIAKSAFAAPGANLNQIQYQKGATVQNVNVNLAAIIGDIILDGQIEAQLSETNDQLQMQISSKSKDIARTYMNAIINQVRVPGGPLVQSNNGPIGIETKFDGMKQILNAESGNVDDVNHPFYNNGASTQTLDLTENDPSSPRLGRLGRVFSLEDMDALRDAVTAGQPDFFMMHSRDIRTLRTLLRNTGGGTDAFQIQQLGLGNMKPMLMLQDIPVFRNDFISRFEGVNLIDTGVVAAVGAATITTAENYSGGVPQALLDGIAEGTAAVFVRDATGILRKYKITNATAANPSVLTVTTTGSFLDVENNINVANVAANDGTAILTGKDYFIYERMDGSEIYCGRWGQMEGVCGFTLANNAGVALEYVGPRENENAQQYRLVWYCGFELYNRLALARLRYVLPPQ